MSDATAASAHGHDHGHDAHGHGHHDPHLAHHFDTMGQQYDSGKLGMWVFLATELLMFGGLFCAYSVYRSNHPEVFIYAHTFLNMNMGAINTAILLASSLTMAWAVRCAQMGRNAGVVMLSLATLAGGAGFMVIKAIEYNTKFEHKLGPGPLNQYNLSYKGDKEYPGMNNAAGVAILKEEIAAVQPKDQTPAGIAKTPVQPYAFLDPNAGGGDAVKIAPRYNESGEIAESQLKVGFGAAPAAHDAHGAPAHGDAHAGGDAHSGEHLEGGMPFMDLNSSLSQQRINTFFGIYYCMTGLHGVHVLVGMGLIIWIAYRAGTTFQKAWLLPLIPLFIGGYILFVWTIARHNEGYDFPIFGIALGKAAFSTGLGVLVLGGLWLLVRIGKVMTVKNPAGGEFSSGYFAPVDLVGLYWHLVDLIWIFLFPLLYLIHGHVGS